jgi:hypothetical protein
MKDEAGRPFIIVREYVGSRSWTLDTREESTLMFGQSGQEEEATWQRCRQVAHPRRKDGSEHCQDFVGTHTQLLRYERNQRIFRDPVDSTRS